MFSFSFLTPELGGVVVGLVAVERRRRGEVREVDGEREVHREGVVEGAKEEVRRVRVRWVVAVVEVASLRPPSSRPRPSIPLQYKGSKYPNTCWVQKLKYLLPPLRLN